MVGAEPTDLQNDSTLSHVYEKELYLGLSQQICKMIQHCHVRAKRNITSVEAMIPTALPKCPWQKIASDIFTLHGRTYPEMIQLQEILIETFKCVFALNGIPEELSSRIMGPSTLRKK